MKVTLSLRFTKVHIKINIRATTRLTEPPQAAGLLPSPVSLSLLYFYSAVIRMTSFDLSWLLKLYLLRVVFETH